MKNKADRYNFAWFCFSFLWINFLYLSSKLCIKNLNLDHHIRKHFMFISAATLEDINTNIVKLNKIVLFIFFYDTRKTFTALRII